MNTGRESFKKSERLCSKKIIASLFEEGEQFYTPRFKVIWFKSPVVLPAPAQVAFCVPKKGFRHAVTRNLLKRRMREAYRKNKCKLYDFLDSENKQIVFMIIFRETNVTGYYIIEKSICEVIDRFIIRIRGSAK